MMRMRMIMMIVMMMIAKLTLNGWLFQLVQREKLD